MSHHKMKPINKKVKVSIIIEPELWTLFRIHCFKKRITMTSIMQDLIKKEIEKNGK